VWVDGSVRDILHLSVYLTQISVPRCFRQRHLIDSVEGEKCHSERSEESTPSFFAISILYGHPYQILRYAQNDKLLLYLFTTAHMIKNSMRIKPLAASLLLCLIFALCSLPAQAQNDQAEPDTALMVVVRNISRGPSNFYLYYTFSNQQVLFKAGDFLEYDIYLDKNNPMPKGGVDVDVNEGEKPYLRDTAAVDQNGLKAHGDTELKQAVGQWYHRKIPLDDLAGKRSIRWNFQFEGDAEGRYVQFVDNVVVTHGDGTSTVIYANGEPPIRAMHLREGYSEYVTVLPVPRTTVANGADLTTFINARVSRQELKQQLETTRNEVDLTRRLAERAGDTALQQATSEAIQSIDNVGNDEGASAEKIQAVIHQVNGALSHEHPLMRKFAGHLVGHAHIDFQWLWEWPETVGVCRDTFGQATKFMAEYPGFSFSQSSSALYAATEQAWPDIFKKMQQYVANGQWEIVGGRVCEGDTNMISPESHARHFLYGQRYFRERFKGKDAIVGWEPDTFGHTWTMPQILKLGGCKYYYFCRGGHNKPLFWWEGPDGSRVLAFEEPATGSWYNSDLSYKQFEEMFNFEKTTGSKDMLWVYGVGNHGGGPTREYIQTALSWQEKSYLPTAKFSTATNFFKALEKYNLSKIPTVKTEMNTTANAGFFGVFTTHSDIKRWNRDAEADTTSAEAIAAFAAQYGYPYPGKEFRRNWEDIAWNHHHDTLPGTSIHPSYNKSEQVYKRVLQSSQTIGSSALNYLAARITGDGTGIVVFNPVGWVRSGIVELPPLVAGATILRSSDGKLSFVQRASATTGKAIFYAENIPAYGYRRYQLQVAPVLDFKAVSPSISNDGTVLENSEYKVVLDPTHGVVSSIVDKKSGHETIAPGGSGNRLEIHWEDPNGMSAWTIGTIRKIEPLVSPVKLQVTESGPARVTVQWTRHFGSSDLVQTVSLPVHGAPEFSLFTKWNEIGSADKPEPFLKVAFDLNAQHPTQTYDIPFGNIQRPTDNVEYPALKWVDSSDNNFGAALLNDCKHGYSAQGNTLRLSLIRSSYNPDPRPNDRPQLARWSLVPHTGNWRAANVLQTAENFNRPLWVTPASPVTRGSLPAQGSFLAVNAPNIVVTGVKQAEDDKDLVVRFYEAYGTPTRPVFALPFRVGRTQTVNFVEDSLPDAQNPPQLRGYEIRTLKLAVQRR